ncbi:biopolymer transporter ExbD [Rubrivirga sp. SAORIC476]|uniref:ExbD/TolR family protein n=1 Tax=Rubrivirga sp. SAORIC476 TaxID=1961794 RepID=UPI000BA91403|nr:biopolymer transporter ExbD [Rubrivirga sp. SAORIC476]MAQ95459.1 biopolymer transporter ExbD [Rhodothermaceae bacterium]MBC11757.1 biopolymer transporter ExbD [Rhodothermaceae bacterium]PAP80719.1 biopolymer transporter ExbD [Rubrivirga sp. SAORIC476]
MSAHFKKKSANTKQEIPTASLPDIIFMLLIFFMVTTVLRETELLVNVSIPAAEAIEKIDQKRLIQYVYIGPEKLESGLGDPAVQIDDAIVRELPQIRQAMYAALRTEPRTIVSMRVDRDVETGLLYDVQQELREAEALRVNYSTSREAE